MGDQNDTQHSNKRTEIMTKAAQTPKAGERVLDVHLRNTNGLYFTLQAYITTTSHDQTRPTRDLTIGSEMAVVYHAQCNTRSDDPYDWYASGWGVNADHVRDPGGLRAVATLLARLIKRQVEVNDEIRPETAGHYVLAAMRAAGVKFAAWHLPGPTRYPDTIQWLSRKEVVRVVDDQVERMKR